MQIILWKFAFSKILCYNFLRKILFNMLVMSFETWNTNPEDVEKNSSETQKLEEEISANLAIPEDAKTAWEILSWFQGNPTLSSEENFKNAYNQKIDSLLSLHLKNLEPEKVQALTALKSQEAEGKNPQQLIESYKQVLSIISTDMAEANKNTTDMLAQKNQATKSWEAQKTNSFIEELKQRGQENLEQRQKQKDELNKRLEIFQAWVDNDFNNAFESWLLTPERSPEQKA